MNEIIQHDINQHDIILHHYPLSLFAEKIRRILAYKKVAWRSVEEPNMMPKPELTSLTGGYRKIPVMQIGADIYCDTACIARRLEELFPDPACIPADLGGQVAMIEDWADHRFSGQVVPAVIVEILPGLPDGILDDRAAMSPLLSKQSLTMMAPHTRSQSLLSMDELESVLRERPWLAGDQFTLADAACYHPLWFLRYASHLYEAVEARPALAQWVQRIDAFGPGDVTPMRRDEALRIAKVATPVDLRVVEGMSMGDVRVGDTVAIRADDIGSEQSRGVVRRITPSEITIVREDDELGEVAVHFPRSGFVVTT